MNLELKAEAVEVLADMANCRRKEGELLEYTQKLTNKNVFLQSGSARHQWGEQKGEPGQRAGACP